MADFAVRATAMEGAFGWDPGSFAEAYEANRREASEVLLGNEPIVDAIEALLNRRPAAGEEKCWSGTATDLLKELNFYADDAIKRTKAWPGGPQLLSRKLRRLAPALRSAGIEYSEQEQGHRKKKVKTLTRPLRDYERSEDPAEENREDGATADDRTPESEEPQIGNPFDFDFGGNGTGVGNPFAADGNEANDPKGQGEEREH
jgi:hypothetical protein